MSVALMNKIRQHVATAVDELLDKKTVIEVGAGTVVIADDKGHRRSVVKLGGTPIEPGDDVIVFRFAGDEFVLGRLTKPGVIESDAVPDHVHDYAALIHEHYSIRDHKYQARDHFIGGNADSGSTGELGWSHAGAVVTVMPSNFDAPGIIQLATGTTINSIARLMLRPSGTTSSVHHNFDMSCRMRFDTAIANTIFRFGYVNPIETTNLDHGVYFDKPAAATGLRSAVRASTSVVSHRASLVTLATGTWYTLRIRRTAYNKFHFTFPGESTEFTATIDLDYPSAYAPFGFQLSNTTAENKTISIDWVDYRIEGGQG